MKRVSVVVIGNSVGIRVRPPLPVPENLNYSQLLEGMISDMSDDLVGHVENMSYHAQLIRDVEGSMETYITKLPHFYILNLGVVDASTREIPLWYYHIQENKGSIRGKILSMVHTHVISRNRKFFVKLRGRNSWVKPDAFSSSYDRVLEILRKETNARIIAMGINPGTRRIEESLPGSLKKYILYSERIKLITEKHGQVYMDMGDFLTHEDHPDGIHFSAGGHRKVAKRLFEEIKKQWQS